MRVFWTLFLATFLAGGALHPAVAAEKPYEETQKKHSWFSFNKPAKKNPADQMAHAEALLAQGEIKKAGKAYRALVTTWPASPQSAQAQFKYAQTLDQRGKLEDAFDEYQYLVEHYMGDFPFDQVVERQFEIANKVMSQKRGVWFFGGFVSPERAVPLFEKLVASAPRSPRAAEAQFLAGQGHELAFDYELAVVAYAIGQQRYPSSPFAEKPAFGRATCWYKLSEDSPNDEEALEQAWAAIVSFINVYPNSEQLEVAKSYRDTILRRRALASYNKALYYDKTARKPEAALVTYQSFVKAFPNSEWTSLAQLRIDELSRTVETK